MLKDGGLTKLDVELQVSAFEFLSAPLADDLPREVLAPKQIHPKSAEWAPGILDKYAAGAPTAATMHGDENSQPTAEALQTDENRHVQTVHGNGQKRTRTSSASGRLPPKKKGKRERETSEQGNGEQMNAQPGDGSLEDEKNKIWTVDDTTRLLEAILGPDSDRMYHLVQVNPKKAFGEVYTPSCA